MFVRLSRGCGVLLSATGMALMIAVSVAPSRAQISFVDMFRSSEYQQTGNGNSLSLTGYFFTLDLNMTNAGDFTSATTVAPGPNHPFLTPLSPLDLHYQTAYYPSQAAMDADFPMGTYSVTGQGGTMGPQTATLDYLADVYPTQQPYLTGTDYSTLQNVNAASPITLHFSPFAADAATSAQFQFFTIFDNTTNTSVYDAGFLSRTASGVTIAANTLTPGDSYTYELIDSNRVTTTGMGGTFAPEIGFDLRTFGTFTAAASSVPEPGSVALLVGLSPSAGLLRRKRAR